MSKKQFRVALAVERDTLNRDSCSMDRFPFLNKQSPSHVLLVNRLLLRKFVLLKKRKLRRQARGLESLSSPWRNHSSKDQDISLPSFIDWQPECFRISMNGTAFCDRALQGSRRCQETLSRRGQCLCRMAPSGFATP